MPWPAHKAQRAKSAPRSSKWDGNPQINFNIPGSVKHQEAPAVGVFPCTFKVFSVTTEAGKSHLLGLAMPLASLWATPDSNSALEKIRQQGQLLGLAAHTAERERAQQRSQHGRVCSDELTQDGDKRFIHQKASAAHLASNHAKGLHSRDLPSPKPCREAAGLAKGCCEGCVWPN